MIILQSCNISATPKLKRGQIPDVEKEKDAIAAKLIVNSLG